MGIFFLPISYYYMDLLPSVDFEQGLFDVFVEVDLEVILEWENSG